MKFKFTLDGKQITEKTKVQNPITRKPEVLKSLLVTPKDETLDVKKQSPRTKRKCGCK